MMAIVFSMQQPCNDIGGCNINWRLASEVRLQGIGATTQQQLHQLPTTA